MYSIWHIESRGSILQKAIINALNHLNDIVYETIVKPNNLKLQQVDRQVSEDNDTILDLMYENDLLKDQVEEDNDAILDIDYRVSQLEDKEV